MRRGDSPPPKRVKLDPGDEGDDLQTSGSTKGKHRAAVFHFFEDLPLDILGEVFCLLGPLDLLHLAWTDKLLRGFLMNRSTSITIWKDALARLDDLPPCPEDLTEPQYTNLMFSNHCHGCLRSDLDLYTYMEARTQLCGACSLVEFKRWNDLSEDVDDSLTELIPATCQKLTNKERSEYSECKRLARTRFHVKTALRLNKELRTIRGKKKRAAWLEQKHIAWKTLEKHAARCEAYVATKAEKKRHDDETVIKRRVDQIWQRLLALGWKAELEANTWWYDNSLRYRPFARKAKELDDEEWGAIQMDAVAWAREKAKEATLKNGANYILQFMERVCVAFQSHIASDQGIIHQASRSTFVELALTQDFLPLAERALLNHGRLEDPDDQEVVDNAISKIPNAVAEWRETWDNFLLNIIGESPAYSGQVITREILPYASTLFLCGQCGNILTYSNVFEHRCFRCWRVYRNSNRTGSNKNKNGASTIPQPNDSKEVSVEDMVRNAYYRATPSYRSVAWRRQRGPARRKSTPLEFHTAGHHHMLALLDELGMERTTQAATVTNLNPLVKCLCGCYKSLKESKPGGKTVIMRWDQAMSLITMTVDLSFPSVCAIVGLMTAPSLHFSR